MLDLPQSGTRVAHTGRHEKPSAERIGALPDDEGHWGYLPSPEQRRAEGCDGAGVHPPKPTDDDWADSLGLSDTIVHEGELADEIARLDRSELLLTGRVLRITWVESTEADRIRNTYFAESRW